MNTCGDCIYWMNHHVCDREWWKDGRWYGPSMFSVGCGKFVSKYKQATTVQDDD